jgi:hypothetical protein
MKGKNTVNNELERTWKESGITCFKTPLSYLTGQTEENIKASHQPKIETQDLPHVKPA